MTNANIHHIGRVLGLKALDFGNSLVSDNVLVCPKDLSNIEPLNLSKMHISLVGVKQELRN